MNELMEKIAKSKSRLGVPVLMALVLGFSVSGAVVAQTCTLDNWNGGAVETGEALLAASRAAGNRAYAGPCSLKVTLDSSDAYLVDDTPLAETQFNVRFYFFLDSVDADVTLFEAVDENSNSIITVSYDSIYNEIDVVFLYDGGDLSESVSVGPLASGWNSLEIQWESKAGEQATISLGNSETSSNSASSGSIDTSAMSIDSVRLGAISGPVAVPSGGVIYFDDYDSRRDTVPGRLMAGDATGDGQLNIFDVVAARNEILGNAVADGIPDCNEDGAVNIFDVVCMRNKILTGS